MKLPLEMFYHWESTKPDSVYLNQPIQGQLHTYTWAQAAHQIRCMATAIKSFGLPPGSNIAIASKNCAHWLFADLAIWMSGHVSVPLYPNLTTNMIKQILEHSESKLLFFGKLDDVKSYLNAIPAGLPTVSFPYGAPEHLTTWDSLIEKHAPMRDNPTRSLDDLATIIYTSGTTGKPKGVMHKFRSFANAGTVIINDLQLAQEERFFSYLPLAHVAERVLTETLALYCGGNVFFAQSLDTFADNLRTTQPTIFLGVPRIWEKFQSGIYIKLPPKKLNTLLSIPILSSLIRKKIKAGLGLSKAKLCVTGAAPISKELLEWYDRLGIQVLEAYGLTENLAFSHFNKAGKKYFGTVGKAWPTVKVELTSDNEVTISSPSLMEGYYKSPEQTAEVLKNGKLYTGDQGSIDAEGNLKITGRVKDLFKTSKGKYVAPTPIELKISSHSFVEQVCVVGSSLPQPLAVLNLSEQAINKNRDEIKSELSGLLKSINPSLDPHERLSKLVVISDSWTIENEFLTPTMKLKRNKVEEVYKQKIGEWGQQRQDVIFA